MLALGKEISYPIQAAFGPSRGRSRLLRINAAFAAIMVCRHYGKGIARAIFARRGHAAMLMFSCLSRQE
jgi:hypothetical protein